MGCSLSSHTEPLDSEVELEEKTEVKEASDVDVVNKVEDVSEAGDTTKVECGLEVEDVSKVEDVSEEDDEADVGDVSALDDGNNEEGRAEVDDVNNVDDTLEEDDRTDVEDVSEVDDVPEEDDFSEVEVMTAVENVSEVDEVSEVDDEVEDVIPVAEDEPVTEAGDGDNDEALVEYVPSLNDSTWPDVVLKPMKKLSIGIKSHNHEVTVNLKLHDNQVISSIETLDRIVSYTADVYENFKLSIFVGETCVWTKSQLNELADYCERNFPTMEFSAYVLHQTPMFGPFVPLYRRLHPVVNTLAIESPDFLRYCMDLELQELNILKPNYLGYCMNEGLLEDIGNGMKLWKSALKRNQNRLNVSICYIFKYKFVVNKAAAVKIAKHIGHKVQYVEGKVSLKLREPNIDLELTVITL
ncbi:unnamed protein product [Bursaphelenchus okinawaensis]|uniref:Uncharacterized protein n=1 Tax=Bursaphelenchus okinawaensis TaxID=465554 RepID=A0A811L5K2_9BILA|nr:unnamed protein product [Bursaphelenchus okinawaensis]CAG9117065.1 unnamed protein product [Bursaphelenchus okinawaensis]